MRSALVASIALFCCGCLGANTTDIAEVPANVELPAPEPEPTPQEKEPAAEEKEPTGEVVQGKRNVAPGNRHPHDIGTRQRGVDWPTFLGPTGDSKSTETGLNTDWRNNRPKIVWRKELGTGYGIGSISRGRYYQFDRFENKATAYCLNAETGAELWTYEYATEYEDLYGYNNGPRCSAVVDDDRVYFYGAGGMLFCLNAYSGDLVWKVDTAKRFGVIQNFFGVGSTPAIDGDLLIVMVGGSPPEAQDIGPGQLDRIDGNGTGIVAFDKMTGEVKYKSSDELASYASMKIATIKGERFGLAFMRGGLVAFHPQTGEQDFHFKWRDKSLESVNASTPVVVGDRVLISETYGPGGALLIFNSWAEVDMTNLADNQARRQSASTTLHRRRAPQDRHEVPALGAKALAELLETNRALQE
ncbi:MAG: PQQ-binding-like beta-propeller repeat protein, partial [Pirellulaceae bacterium]|nr:PQQ-binding-like beta-propeller repeat protein [Pirellulaceae bacterium]